MKSNDNHGAVLSAWHDVPYDVEMAIRADERRRLKFKFLRRSEWLESRNKTTAAYSVKAAAEALIKDPRDMKRESATDPGEADTD